MHKNKRRWAAPFVGALIALGLAVPASAAPLPDVTVTAAVDAYVAEATPTTAKGATDVQNCFVNDDSPSRQICFMSFTVTGLGSGDSVTGAQVLLRTKGNSTAGKTVLLSSVPTSFTESTVTWNNRPALGSQLASVSSFAFKTDAAFNIGSGVITANGTYTFAAWASPGTMNVGTNFYSKENTDGQPGPRLVLSVDHQSSPVAVLTQPDPVNEDAVTTLTAINSTDPDNDIASYDWDFGDGTTPVVGAAWWFIDHTYANPGTYPVTVTVHDSGGRTSSDTKSIVVNNVNDPPVAALTISPSSSGTVPFTVTANASGSTDPDNNVSTYAFNWGDGSAVTGPQVGATATHTYNLVGSYTVTVTVTDATSLTDTKTATATTTARFPGDPGVGEMRHGGNASTQFNTVQTAMPNPFGTRRVYNSANWGVPSAASTDVAAGRVPIISWKFAPYTVSTVPQSAINQTCTDLKNLNGNAIAVIYHEPGDIPAAERPAYRALQRNTVTTCDSMGVTNIAWASPLFEGPFGFTTESGHRWSSLYADCASGCDTSSPTFYAGSNRVYDLDGVDLYDSASLGDTRPISVQMGVVENAMTSKGLTPLPWVIGELGINSAPDPSARAAKMQAAWTYLKANAAKFPYVAWWMTGGEEFCATNTSTDPGCGSQNVLVSIQNDPIVVHP